MKYGEFDSRLYPGQVKITYSLPIEEIQQIKTYSDVEKRSAISNISEEIIQDFKNELFNKLKEYADV